MSKPGGISFGLNLSKKPGLQKKPALAKRKPFGGNDDSDDDDNSSSTAKPAAGKVQAIGELDGFETPGAAAASRTPEDEDDAQRRKAKARRNAPPAAPPTLKARTNHESALFGDLAGALTARRNAAAAEAVDPSVYDYDGVYDALKATSARGNRTADDEDGEEAEGEAARKPRYMKSVIAAAAVRKRDALIAEEKKIAREREEEGEAFADKEKFVTEAYRKQQEENRRIEAEEKRREEEEERKNKAGGMTAFYKGLLNRGEERHQEMMKAAEEQAKNAPAERERKEEKGQQQQHQQDEEQPDKEATDANRASEINKKGGKIAINEDGQVVDKRELLRGGLNVGAKKEAQVRREASRPKDDGRDRGSGSGFIGAGGKGAMRERQTRMLEQQLAESLKRSREEEEQEREKIETSAKSRKTEGEISSAKERYLARKREAEEAKKKKAAE
ncbi:hypothetical protein HYQ46_007443 [Verticillium longisporum]|nr:hypothetical protein HYQ46_007443 [Verticillium longisporum]